MESDVGTTGGTNVLSVSCNHCGAPLSPPAGTRFITCTYCGTQLEIHITGGAAYTQIIQDINQRTQRIETHVDEIRSHDRLEQLDREWLIERDRYAVRGNHGNAIPSIIGLVVATLIFLVFGSIWTYFAVTKEAPVFLQLFGVVFTLAGVCKGIYAIAKSSAYANAEAAYRQQRQEILAQMGQRKWDVDEV